MRFIKVQDTVGFCDCWINVDKIEAIYDKKIIMQSNNLIFCKESKDEIIKKIMISGTDNFEVTD